MVHHSIIRVQIREEVRAYKHAKARSNIEVTFELPTNLKKRRLEDKIVQEKVKKLRKELSQMTMDELQTMADNLDLYSKI